MISSRCNDEIQLNGKTATLTELRKQLKQELEQVRLLGSELFDVWINEDAPPAEGTVDSWEHCLQQVQAADLVLVLYNGNAGWAKEGGEIGICHAELYKALTTAPAKVRLIELPQHASSSSRDKRFQDFVTSQSRFRGASVKDGGEAITRCHEALRDAVPNMVRLGVREARRGKYHMGDALEWSRLDFEARRKAMVNALRDALLNRTGSCEESGKILLQIGGSSVIVACHAVPASMTAPGALDLMHQPFLHDHTCVSLLIAGAVGPVHFFACNRSVTEAQAIKQLGFPDATVVMAPFGVYVADNVQKIQLVFLSNCRDETSTRHGVQRFFEWLEQTGEKDLLAERAASRGRIVRAIARELMEPRD